SVRVIITAAAHAKLAFFKPIRHSPGFGIAPEVVGSDARRADRGGVLLQQLPDDLLAQGKGANSVAAIHRPKYLTSDHACSRGPRVARLLDPGRHRNGPDAPVLADEVHDAPSGIPLLDVPERNRRHLRPP